MLICLIFLLSYSSISYTSLQLLKPLAVYNRIAGTRNWHFYWSPSITFAKGWRVLYIIVAVFCEAIISVGLPFLLLFKDTFFSKINLNRLKPILDQLQGCYKDEYRWFAAFYLICRQVIYLTDLAFDFWSSSVYYSNVEKHSTFLIITIIIMTIHIWCQPYRIKSLNTFDGAILMTSMFAMFASHSNNFLLRISLWFLPLVIFISYITSSTKLKHIVIPIICLGTLAFCGFLLLFDMKITVIIITLISLYYLIKYVREVFKSCRQRCRTAAGYLEVNNDDDNEELYKSYEKTLPE